MKQKSNKNKVVVEDGEVKIIYSEEALRTGSMPAEEALRLSHEQINKLAEILGIQ